MPTVSPSEIYIIILLGVNFMGGIANVSFLISFIKQCKSRFLSARNPSLVILYCVIALITTFVTTPIDLYYATFAHDSSTFFASFAAELFHELCTTMLLIVILCRSWLLYYDYKFSECSSDVIWRSVVNASEDNWFISHRKTLGNLHFIICFALVCISVSLLSLSWIGGAVVLSAHNVVAFHYLSMFGLATPLFGFIIYLTQYKIQLLNDIYLIHREIKYLSYCVLCRIVAFVIDLIGLHRIDDYFVFYTMEVATTFLSVWIQCRWVTVQLQRQQDQKHIDLYLVMNAAPSNTPPINPVLASHGSRSPLRHVDSMSKRANVKHGLLKIINIFDEESAFKEFIRHCTHELSVESILFLIEIAQFKATLEKYNAQGIEPLSFRFVDVINSNFVKYIVAKRKEEEDKQLVFHPVYDEDESDSNEEQNKTVSLKTKSRPESAVASMKQEAEYKRFTETILSKKWLPLNMLLSSVKDIDSNRKRKKTNSSKSSGNKNNSSREDTKSKTSTKTNQLTKTKSLSKTDVMTPIALAVIGDDASGGATSASDNDDHETATRTRTKENKRITRQTSTTERTQTRTNTHTHSSDNNNNEEMMSSRTVDINWMIEYGRYLYAKYVDNSANLAINISHTIRRDLWSVYSKEMNEEAFQTIELMHHEHLSSISRLNGKEEQKFIQTFIFHSFDAAFHAVWQLLKSDTFYRFQKTKQYKTLCQDADKDKIQNAQTQRDREYSKSYNESQIDIV